MVPILTMVLVFAQNIMKQKVSIIDIFVMSASPRMVRFVLTLQVSVSKNTQKRVELGMATVYHNGSAQGLWDHKPLRHIIFWRKSSNMEEMV